MEVGVGLMEISEKCEFTLKLSSQELETIMAALQAATAKSRSAPESSRYLHGQEVMRANKLYDQFLSFTVKDD